MSGWPTRTAPAPSAVLQERSQHIGLRNAKHQRVGGVISRPHVHVSKRDDARKRRAHHFESAQLGQPGDIRSSRNVVPGRGHGFLESFHIGALA